MSSQTEAVRKGHVHRHGVVGSHNADEVDAAGQGSTALASEYREEGNED